MKTLVWQAKEFTVYAEVTGVCLKEFECGRNMAISGHIIDGWERSVWLCFAHFIGEEPISLEVYAMVPGGYDEDLNKAWELGNLSHSYEREFTG